MREIIIYKNTQIPPFHTSTQPFRTVEMKRLG